jgi:UDP-N-acetylglucosamine 1-carboxyvinyltransferase
MRASYYFVGAMLGRFGSAEVSMPGGCNLGVRPIDQHIKGFEALGATVTLEHGIIDANCNDGLVGASVYFDTVTVGGTINVMLAAVKANGLTVIENAAREPHVVDVANFLNAMGADVKGAGTDVIKIKGVSKLTGTDYTIIPDQIEAGTFMVAAAATGGSVMVKNVIPKHLESITAKLQEMNVTVDEFDDAVLVRRSSTLSKANIKTQVYPGVPTDMQPQFAVLLCLAEGTSIITEGIFDNRFKYVDELKRVGAHIQVDGKVAVVQGSSKLTGAPVKACDLRAGAALVIAGLCASGITEIDEISHIERGYENFVDKLLRLGADIKKVTLPEINTIQKAE